MTRKDLTSETRPDTFNVAAEAEARGIKAYQVRASRAVNDRLMADIVSDFRRGPSAPSSMATRPGDSKPEPVTKGTGWHDAVPLKPVDTRWVDAQCEAQDRLDKVAAIRQRIEAAWIESHFEKSPRIETDWNPFSRENLDK